MTHEEPIWALLVPLGRPELVEVSEQYRREVAVESGAFDPDEDELEPAAWQVIGGKGAYSALVDFDPGSEGTDDELLAKRISRKAEQPVYVLYFVGAYDEGDAIAVYKRGRQTGTDGRSPHGLARELGLALPGDLEAKPKKKSPARSAKRTVKKSTRGAGRGR